MTSAEMPRRRRPRRLRNGWTMALTAATASAVLSTAGCVQMPQHVTAVEDPRPSLRHDIGATLAQRYVVIDGAAWQKHNTSRLSAVATGPELEAQTRGITLRRRIGTKDESTGLPQDATYAVSSSPGGHYPALAVISGTGEGEKVPDSFYLAERATAADPWLISYSTSEDLNTFLPDVSKRSDHVFEPADPKQKVNGVTAGKLPDLVADALGSPDSKVGKRFAANAAFNDAKAVPLSKKAGAHQERRFDYFSAPWHQSYRTADGDLIVFGAFTQTIHYENSDRYYTRFSSGDQHKLLPGKYSGFTYTNYWQYAARVPPKGKIVLQSISGVWDDLTGTPYTEY